MFLNKKTIIKSIPKIGVGYCVGKVVDGTIKTLAPEPTDLKTKIVYKIGTAGVTAAVTQLMTNGFDEFVDFTDGAIRSFKEVPTVVERKYVDKDLLDNWVGDVMNQLEENGAFNVKEVSELEDLKKIVDINIKAYRVEVNKRFDDKIKEFQNDGHEETEETSE